MDSSLMDYSNDLHAACLEFTRKAKENLGQLRACGPFKADVFTSTKMVAVDIVITPDDFRRLNTGELSHRFLFPAVIALLGRLPQRGSIAVVRLPADPTEAEFVNVIDDPASGLSIRFLYRQFKYEIDATKAPVPTLSAEVSYVAANG